MKRDAIREAGWIQGTMLLVALAGLIMVVSTASIAPLQDKPGMTCTLDEGPVAMPAGPGDFLSRWNTTLTSLGSSGSNQVRLPLHIIGTYNFLVRWGDGSNDTITAWNQAQTLHTYASPGVYDINITGQIKGWSFGGGGDRLKIIEISQWGCLDLALQGHIFYTCTNLVLTAIDAPGLTGVNSLAYVFYGCAMLGSSGSMSAWDVSSVETMEYMFYGATTFNQDIGAWDVSSVEYMEYMFYGATTFNQDIGAWNVSSVWAMDSMFFGAASFNQAIGAWNVSRLESMECMFYYATSFNQDIGAWDVSSVTSMTSIFGEAASFNQDIGAWNVSSLINSAYMFENATSFNQDIGAWNVSRVENMECMFDCATSFNQDIGAWDVSSVTNMLGMFYNDTSFNQDIGAWNVSRVTLMNGMFSGVTLTTANYDSLLLGWGNLAVRNNVVFHAGDSRYSTAAASARQHLVSSHVWNIMDAGTNEFPAISAVANITYVQGTDEHSIAWNITDATTGTTHYTIYRDGTSIASGTWASGSWINISINGLAAGTYNYTIAIDDGLTGTAVDTVFVVVTSPPPQENLGYYIILLVAVLAVAIVAIVLARRRKLRNRKKP